MKSKNFTISILKHKYIAAVIAVFILGAVIRLVGFFSLPLGFNQDEAYAAYEAYSILNYGVDSYGYVNPVYFVAWGSGMNVLETYLAIPFFWLFGESVTVFRIPQMLISLGAMISFWFLLKELCCKRTALIGLIVFASSPWQIMMSKWGLESNLAPGFIIFTLLFIVKGLKNNKYLLLASFFAGLTLYTYSTTWLALPAVLLFIAIYIAMAGIKVSVKYLLPSLGILFVFALPLILFLGVNYDFIPEIRTSFISIPKLVAMRDGEVVPSRLTSADAYKELFNLIITQNDNLISNAIDGCGIYYTIGLPFLFIGIARLAVKTVICIIKKSFSFEILVLPCMLSVALICVMISSLNINRVNCLIPFLLISIALGIDTVILLAGKLRFHAVQKAAAIIILLAYFLSFSSFATEYYGKYQTSVGSAFMYGLEDAVEFVKAEGFDNVYVDLSICFADILYFDKTPHDVFSNTVVYNNWPSPFMNIHTFSNYTFEISYDTLQNIGLNSAYIFRTSDNYYKAFMENCGMNFSEFGFFTVAY